MPNGVKKIHGFIRDEERGRPNFNETEFTEVALVEAYNVTDHIFQLIDTLPAAGFPGNTGFNPAGITFSFYFSTHPKSSNFVLLQCGNIEKVSESGVFWRVELTYGNYIPSAITSIDKQTGSPIVNPLNQPVIWSSSTNIVQKQTLTKPSGELILHEHGLPLTEPITYEDGHTVHTWNFNKNYNSLNYHNEIGLYVGSVGNSPMFGTEGQRWKCVAASAQEAYESFGSGNTRTVFHYVKINISIEYNPSGWVDDVKLVSRSTMQKVSGQFIPIDINGNGDRAEEPWPLLVKEDADNCYGAPYDDLDPNKFAILYTGYPQRANLAALVSAYGLSIP